MYYEKICSLCVETRNKNNSCSLFRIADLDLENGELIPFSLYTDIEYGGQNINCIFNPKIPNDGKVSLWDWECIATNKQHSYLNTKNRWIEYIELSDAHSLNDVLSILNNGLESIEQEHDYLFTYSDHKEPLNCLFVRGVDLQILHGKATLKDRINYLMYYQIHSNEILEISTHFLPGFVEYYYCYIDLPEPSGKIYVKDKFQIIKELIKAEINKTYVPNGSNHDKAVVRNFLDVLPNSPLSNSLMQCLDCNISEAEEYIKQFLTICEQYYSCEDYTAEIMKRLIDNNAKIADLFRIMVQRNWQEQNSALIEENDRQLNAKKKEIENLNKEIESLSNKKKLKEKAIEDLDVSYNQMRQTAIAIESEVRGKIVAAQQNIAQFFSEYAMFMPYNNNSIAAPNNTNIFPVNIVSETPDKVTDLDDLFKFLAENIETIGVEKRRCKAVSAYILAAYFMKQPLIMAGYGATLLLDALNVTLNNKKANQIYDLKNIDEKSLKQLPYGSVVGLHSAFDMTFVNRIVSENPHIYFAIISPTIEELAIEPRSIYNYALPLFSEYFVINTPVDDLVGSVASVEYKYDFSNVFNNTVFAKLLPDYMLPMYAKQQCTKLAGSAQDIYNNLKSLDILIIQVLPLMCLLQGREKTVDYINKQNLSDEEKGELKRLIGEEA